MGIGQKDARGIRATRNQLLEQSEHDGRFTRAAAAGGDPMTVRIHANLFAGGRADANFELGSTPGDGMEAVREHPG